jgi:hypothetical protein
MLPVTVSGMAPGCCAGGRTKHRTNALSSRSRSSDFPEQSAAGAISERSSHWILENDMNPRNKQRSQKQEETEAPTIEQQDWDSFEGNKVLPDSVVTENGPDLREAEQALPEEDDDNSDQESDEALPDDEEERILSRDPSKEGSRFDEV